MDCLNAIKPWYMEGKCDNKERAWEWAYPFPRVSRYKRRSSLTEGKVYLTGEHASEVEQYYDAPLLNVAWTNQPVHVLVPWRQGFKHPTRNKCMGWFAQISWNLGIKVAAQHYIAAVIVAPPIIDDEKTPCSQQTRVWYKRWRILTGFNLTLRVVHMS